MQPIDSADIVAGLRAGNVVPYLGPGALAGAHDKATGAPIPADSDSLILAMNGGRPMAPKLMFEFPRAAMNPKRGRRFIDQFLTKTYGETKWTRAPLHDWLATVRPAYVIDVNRDTQLQESYATVPHLLVRGVARIGGTDYRFVLSQHDGTAYRGVSLEQADTNLPVLFKPAGSPVPEPLFIASDADYVDYITELMGGFGMPSFLKSGRVGKRYLFLGMRFNRDTERMVMSDIIHDAGEPAGWALIPEPTEKEMRFLKKKRIEVIRMDVAGFLEAVANAPVAA
ncbi:MAG: SIR2 family protein [Hyphomicrobiales bacterium]